MLISINGLYGSGGNEMGYALAERLGYTVYDGELIEKAVADSGVDLKQATLAFYDEDDGDVENKLKDPYKNAVLSLELDVLPIARQDEVKKQENRHSGLLAMFMDTTAINVREGIPAIREKEDIDSLREAQKREILRMASLAMENVRRALNTVSTLDFAEGSVFGRTEDELDYLNDALIKYVVKLSSQRGLSERDRVYLSSTYRTVRDLERIGDYAENFMEYADALRQMNQRFSPAALDEIRQLADILDNLYAKAVAAYEHEDFAALEAAGVIEEETDDFTKEMEDNHIMRLTNGTCTPGVGAQYLALSSNAERIADHLFNVAKSIRVLAA